MSSGSYFIRDLYGDEMKEKLDEIIEFMDQMSRKHGCQLDLEIRSWGAGQILKNNIPCSTFSKGDSILRAIKVTVGEPE
jgi:hypothetical protein